jgi:hypothetical protein
MVGETVGAVVNGVHDLGSILEVRLLGKRGLQAFVDGDTIEAKYVIQLPSGVVVISCKWAIRPLRTTVSRRPHTVGYGAKRAAPA